MVKKNNIIEKLRFSIKKIRENKQKWFQEKPFNFSESKDDLFSELEDQYGEQEAARMMELIEECLRENDVDQESPVEVTVCIQKSLAIRKQKTLDEVKEDAETIGGHMCLGGHIIILPSSNDN